MAQHQAATQTRRADQRLAALVARVPLVAVLVARVAAAQTLGPLPVVVAQAEPEPTQTTQVPARAAKSRSLGASVEKKIPVAKLDGTCTWVTSKDAAALAGLAKLPGGTQEFAGALYENPEGNFCYSEAIPGTRDDFIFQTDPKAGKFAGMYHSHHGKQESEFSPTDATRVQGLNRTGYIRENGTGTVRRLEPGDLPSSERGTNRGSVMRDRKVLGTVVGTVPVPEKTRREALEAAYDLHNPEGKK